MNYFHSIVKGLQEAIAYNEGKQIEVIETSHAVFDDGFDKKTLTTRNDRKRMFA